MANCSVSGEMSGPHHFDRSQESWVAIDCYIQSVYCRQFKQEFLNFNMKLFPAIVAGFLAITSAQSSSPNASISLLEVIRCLKV